MITSDDDNDDGVGPNNHNNNGGIFLPKLETASQSGSPSSLHDAPRVNTGRRDSTQVDSRSRTPSRGRTRYRFSTLRGPSEKRHRCFSSRAVTRERSPTKELPTPALHRPLFQNLQRHTSPAEERRRKSQNRNRTSLERTTGSSESPILGESYVAGVQDEDYQDERGYIPKGAFLVRKEPNSDQYRFPKASGKPQSPWLPGDGFSDAEAKTDFLFFVTGKRKRRVSPSLPGMGKLTTGTDGPKSSDIRAHGKRARKNGAYQQKSELLRGGKKNVWPTRHDFIDSTLPRRDEEVLDDCSVDELFVPNTLLSPPRYEPQSTLKSSHWKSKGPLDFRNFETEEATRSSLLSDLRRVRAWREESSPCADEDSDDDGDTFESNRGSQASGPIDTGNEDEDNDSNSTNSKCSDEPSGGRFDDQALPNDLGQGEGE